MLTVGDQLPAQREFHSMGTPATLQGECRIETIESHQLADLPYCQITRFWCQRSNHSRVPQLPEHKKNKTPENQKGKRVYSANRRNMNHLQIFPASKQILHSRMKVQVHCILNEKPAMYKTRLDIHSSLSNGMRNVEVENPCHQFVICLLQTERSGLQEMSEDHLWSSRMHRCLPRFIRKLH